jgi:multidrug efflux system outer membrane protein
MMRRLFYGLAIVSLAGCTVGPDYRPPKTAVADAWIEAGTAGPVDRVWWQSFGDPELTRLVEQALASSPDLAEARARLAEARANRDATTGGRLPMVEANGSATKNVLSKNGQIPVGQIPGFTRDFSMFDLGFDASWELDFWGRRTRQIEGATARVDAAAAAQQDVMLTLIAEVARSYFDLRAAQAEIATALAMADADAETATLTRLRLAAGEVSRIDADRAEAQAKTSAGAVPGARSRAAAAAYRIATLLGRPPEAVVPALTISAALPATPDAILVGVRSDLLARRPDVRRAERELAAATADIGVATGDLFPRFSLFGSIGQQGRTVGDLFSGGSTRLQVGPSFSWPVFSGGTIRAQIRGADARAQGAAARYDKAVIGALSDSESAINGFLNARAAFTDADAALLNEKSAFALGRQRADRGEDDRLALLRAQAALITAQTRYDAAGAAKGQAAIALFKSLGGGWR